MPVVINVVTYRSQSLDLGAHINVGQVITSSRRAFTKRNWGYGENVGHYSITPSSTMVLDSDGNDSAVIMPLVDGVSTAGS